MEKEIKHLSSIENKDDLVPGTEYHGTENDLMRLGIYTEQPVEDFSDLMKLGFQKIKRWLGSHESN